MWNALSYFPRETKVDFGALEDSVDPAAHCRALSIGSVSASLNFLKKCSVSKVLEAVTWRLNSVLASSYFKYSLL